MTCLTHFVGLPGCFVDWFKWFGGLLTSVDFSPAEDHLDIICIAPSD